MTQGSLERLHLPYKEPFVIKGPSGESDAIRLFISYGEADKDRYLLWDKRQSIKPEELRVVVSQIPFKQEVTVETTYLSIDATGVTDLVDELSTALKKELMAGRLASKQPTLEPVQKFIKRPW